MDWNAITKAVVNAVKTGAPIAAAAFPEAAIAIQVVEHIVQGVQDAEPSALALKNMIVDGQEPTPEQLKEYADRYELAYEKLDNDINARLAQLDAEEASAASHLNNSENE